MSSCSPASTASMIARATSIGSAFGASTPVEHFRVDAARVNAHDRDSVAGQLVA
jgi:hypothetical protein